MKTCAIWGATDLAICQGLILENGSNIDMHFIGSYDKNSDKCSEMPRPISKSEVITADIIFAEQRLVESVKRDLEIYINNKNEYPEVLSCQSFMKDYLNVHPKAVGNGSGFAHWIVSARKFMNAPIENFFEVGSNYSQDANFVKQVLGIKDNNIYCFEGNTNIVKEASEFYSYNSIHSVVSNKNGTMKMHMVPEDAINSGLSTVVNYPTKSEWKTEDVRSIRLDDFMEEENISSMDFLKIDVEGISYEVLEGLGQRISDVKCVQLEAEYLNKYEKHAWKDIMGYLISKGFILVDYCPTSKYQCDSLWINEEYLDVALTN